jgi:hypothetical protein
MSIGAGLGVGGGPDPSPRPSYSMGSESQAPAVLHRSHLMSLSRLQGPLSNSWERPRRTVPPAERGFLQGNPLVPRRVPRGPRPASLVASWELRSSAAPRTAVSLFPHYPGAGGARCDGQTPALTGGGAEPGRRGVPPGSAQVQRGASGRRLRRSGRGRRAGVDNYHGAARVDRLLAWSQRILTSLIGRPLPSGRRP